MDLQNAIISKCFVLLFSCPPGCWFCLTSYVPTPTFLGEGGGGRFDLCHRKGRCCPQCERTVSTKIALDPSSLSSGYGFRRKLLGFFGGEMPLHDLLTAGVGGALHQAGCGGAPPRGGGSSKEAEFDGSPSQPCVSPGCSGSDGISIDVNTLRG